MAAPTPVELDEPEVDDLTSLASPWVTIVWNDPVNLMSYVTFVFQKYFGYDRQKAEKLMLEVHHDGRSVVSTGSREEMERDVQAMHEYGLWATMQKADAQVNTGFSRHRRTGACVATFSAFEADLLRSLAGQLIELLRNEEATPGQVDPLEELMDFSGPTTAPEDPVLARLFPTAYPDDEEAAADFRRFTEGNLRNGKAAAASAVIDALEEAGLPPEPEDGLFIDVELDEPAALSWLRSFTDMRLAIATRLGIEDDDDSEEWEQLPDGDPRGQVYEIYQWVGFLQETLVDAASG